MRNIALSDAPVCITTYPFWRGRGNWPEQNDLDVLESSKVGVYSIKTHAFSKPEIVNFLLYTIMKIDAAGYYSLLDLEHSLYLFPFEYQVKKESIMEDDRFLLGTFGGQISFSLKR